MTRASIVLAGLVVVAPAAAHAQELRSRVGAALSVGGGVSGFVGDTMRDLTGRGGAWNVRGAIGTRSLVGFEAAYVGAAYDIEAAGLDTDNDGTLLSQSAEGALRLNLPLAVGRTVISPFGFGGVGYTRYEITGIRRNVSSVRDGDNTLVVPFGGGLSIANGGAIFDARFTYRSAFDEDLAPSLVSGGDTASLSTWMGSVQIGYEF